MKIRSQSFTSPCDGLFARIHESELYRDYEEAFRKAVGLPLELHRPGMDRVLRPKKADAAPFCSLMAGTNQSCKNCLALQAKLEEQAGFAPKTLKCFAGLCETAVPVRVGGNLIAFLHTGHVIVGAPKRGSFSRTATLLLEWGRQVDLKRLEEAYFSTRIFSQSQYDSVVRLLEVFSRHLAASGATLPQVALNAEPFAVGRARRLVETHSADDISLAHVSRMINVSAGYFCEMFKKATGLTFVAYLSRVRIEKAKNLLLNPNLRISEIAFDVGFQSLSQFNRAFRKLEQCSPGEYRAHIAEPRTAARSRQVVQPRHDERCA